jgi:hypothetical protein
LHVLDDANEIIALQLEVDGQAVFDCDGDLAKVVGLHQVGPPVIKGCWLLVTLLIQRLPLQGNEPPSVQTEALR